MSNEIKDTLAKHVGASFATILSERLGERLRALDNPLAWECSNCHAKPQEPCKRLTQRGTVWVDSPLHQSRVNHARTQLLGAVYGA